jgi:hypothetical protein
MIKKFFTYKIVKIFSIGLIFLLSGIFFVYYLNQYLYRSKAGASSATFSFLPNNLSLKVGEVSAPISLLLQFQDGSGDEKIDYLKLVLNFPKDNLELADYIDTSTSGLSRQIRVDGPVAANGSGQIIIELGANSPGAGPATNTSPITVAKLKFRGKSIVNNSQITIDNVQIVNNASAAITTPLVKVKIIIILVFVTRVIITAMVIGKTVVSRLKFVLIQPIPQHQLNHQEVQSV